MRIDIVTDREGLAMMIRDGIKSAGQVIGNVTVGNATVGQVFLVDDDITNGGGFTVEILEMETDHGKADHGID